MSTTHLSHPTVPLRKGPRRRTVLISAWSIAPLVIGQFGMLAIVPVSIVAMGATRDPNLRGLRPAAAGLVAIYATPLALWAIGPDRAQSLSKDMDPVFIPLISLTAVAFAVAATVVTRQQRPTGTTLTEGAAPR